MLVKSAVLPQLKLLAGENWGELLLFTCTGPFPHLHGACGGVLLKISLVCKKCLLYSVTMCEVQSYLNFKKINLPGRLLCWFDRVFLNNSNFN